MLNLQNTFNGFEYNYTMRISGKEYHGKIINRKFKYVYLLEIHDRALELQLWLHLNFLAQRKYDGKEMIDTVWYDTNPTITTFKRIHQLSEIQWWDSKIPNLLILIQIYFVFMYC